MNPHNIPRFTEGSDLHFTGGEDAPLLFPSASMEEEGERKPGEEPNDARGGKE